MVRLAPANRPLPEVLDGSRSPQLLLQPEVDVWSLGCIILDMASCSFLDVRASAAGGHLGPERVHAPQGILLPWGVPRVKPPRAPPRWALVWAMLVTCPPARHSRPRD